MRDVRLDAEQRLAVDLEVHLPLGDRVMARGVDIAPQALQAVGVGETRRAVRGDEHFHGFAAVLRDEGGIDRGLSRAR